MASKETVMNTINDTVCDLLIYNRKEDEELPIGEIERMVSEGEVTVEEIVNEFQSVLVKTIKG